MTFDIHEKILNEDGYPVEGKFWPYLSALLDLFEASPEAQALPNREEPSKSFWARMVLDIGARYLGATPPSMTPEDQDELLFDLFPAQISVLKNESATAFPDLRAFWLFLKREFALENTDAILAALDSEADARFQREMNNPANFGPAKSMVMAGMDRGFDMSTEEGINAWMTTFQEEILDELGSDVPFPDEFFGEELPPGEQPPRPLIIGDLAPDWTDLASPARGSGQSAQRKARRKRKMAKESRKRNRKKK